MSAGYAERLSEYPNKGVCGLPESYDSQRAFNVKLDRLAQLIQQSKYTVVLTGAGISTSAGIPDFRGPSGIWTREQQERKRRKKNNSEKVVDCVDKALECSDTAENAKLSPNSSRKRKETEQQPTKKFISFENALPTYTHKALSHLILHPPLNTTQSLGDEKRDTNDTIENTNSNGKAHRKYLHHVVTQNVDGLHRKTNLPRDNMSILHGCIFTEICDTCNTEHVRKHEIQSIGLKHTGRNCTLGGSPVGSCPGKLKDTLLDWEDDLPEIDWEKAQEECYKADLVLCLGTSLRIEPAASLCTYPTYPASVSKKKKGRKKRKPRTKLGYAIVNLQQTPYDDGAALVLRGKVDDVMKGVMGRLGYNDNWEAT